MHQGRSREEAENQGRRVETRVTLEVPSSYHSDTRLDIYITGFLPNVTRTRVQQGIRDGHVKVMGKVVKPSYQVQPGDVIECTVMRAPPLEARPEPIPLDILYEDEYLIVVNKPAGMVVHPGYGHRSGTLVNALLHHVGGGTVSFEDHHEQDLEDDELGLSTVSAAPAPRGDVSIRPGLVHRLDKDTSGVMVVAKDNATHAHLAGQFARRTIRRAYRAVVWRSPDQPAGTIETALARDPRDRKKMAVVPPDSGRHAITRYKLLEAHRFTSLVQFTLETGRTHQIRVHARHLGTPIFGDPVYGGDRLHFSGESAQNRAFFSRLIKSMPRQALHARTLGFTHPADGGEVFFETDYPADMAETISELRRHTGPEVRELES